jgi:NADH-quinone oxidoreductase subunit A
MALWPLAVHAVLAVTLVAAMILIPRLVAERHEQASPAQPYESGMLTTGEIRPRFSMQFYLFSLFFLIFDLEVIYLFAWASAARELGWAGYVEAAIFIAVLLVALLYLWREGALDWGTTAQLKHGARARNRPLRTGSGRGGRHPHGAEA